MKKGKLKRFPAVANSRRLSPRHLVKLAAFGAVGLGVGFLALHFREIQFVLDGSLEDSR